MLGWSPELRDYLTVFNCQPAAPAAALLRTCLPLTAACADGAACAARGGRKGGLAGWLRYACPRANCEAVYRFSE
jgi:hypothetical protein